MQINVNQCINVRSVVQFCGFGFVPRIGYFQYVLFFGKLQWTEFVKLLYFADIQICLQRFSNFAKQKRPLKRDLWSGKRDSNSRPQPWQGCALPTELFPQYIPDSRASLLNSPQKNSLLRWKVQWEKMDSNHRRRSQQIYSLPHLATLVFSLVTEPAPFQKRSGMQK